MSIQIEVSPEAQSQVRELIKSQAPGTAVRVFLQESGGGCGGGDACGCGGEATSGPSFGMSFDRPRNGDEVVRSRRLRAGRRPIDRVPIGRRSHRLRPGTRTDRLQDRLAPASRTRCSDRERMRLRRRGRRLLLSLLFQPLPFCTTSSRIAAVRGLTSRPSSETTQWLGDPSPGQIAGAEGCDRRFVWPAIDVRRLVQLRRRGRASGFPMYASWPVGFGGCVGQTDIPGGKVEDLASGAACRIAASINRTCSSQRRLTSNSFSHSANSGDRRIDTLRKSVPSTRRSVADYRSRA